MIRQTIVYVLAIAEGEVAVAAPVAWHLAAAATMADANLAAAAPAAEGRRRCPGHSVHPQEAVEPSVWV